MLSLNLESAVERTQVVREFLLSARSDAEEGRWGTGRGVDLHALADVMGRQRLTADGGC